MQRCLQICRAATKNTKQTRVCVIMCVCVFLILLGDDDFQVGKEGVGFFVETRVRRRSSLNITIFCMEGIDLVWGWKVRR